MERHWLVIAYLATTAYYGCLVTLALLRPFPAGAGLMFTLVALPAIVLALLNAPPEWAGIPVLIWSLASVAFVIAVDDTGDFERVGVLFLMLLLYTPVILIAFVMGKSVRWILARRSAQY